MKKIMKPRSFLSFGMLMALIVALVAIIVFYQPVQEGMLLSELFPSAEKPSHIEYEIVDQSGQVSLELPSPQENFLEEEVPSPLASNPPAGTVAVSVTPGVWAQPKSNTFTIQIASFQDAVKAEKALENLRAKYSSAYIASKDLGEKGVWYRVCLGQFEARREADELLADVKKTFKDSFVVLIK